MDQNVILYPITAQSEMLLQRFINKKVSEVLQKESLFRFLLIVPEERYFFTCDYFSFNI